MTKSSPLPAGLPGPSPASSRGAAAHRIAGALAAAPGAAELAHHTALLLERYVHEVVLAFRLCPFLQNPESALGAVVIVLDPAPDEQTLVEIVEASDLPVIHAVYPLAPFDSPPFERFASRVGTSLRAKMGRAAPVSAAFHPTMHGDVDDPHRLIGILRRAPHPFVQYVPEGVTQGMGTTIAGAPPAEPSGAAASYARLKGGELPRVLAAIGALHAARDAIVAPLAAKLLAGR